MKSARPAVLVLLMFAAGLAIVVWFGGPDEAPVDLVTADAPVVRVDADGRPVLEVREAAASTAEKPTPPIRMRVVDASSDRPIARARIFRSLDGELLATTGAEGFATVSRCPINAMVFGADGYLLEHYFDRIEKARALAATARRDGYVRVLLSRDELTTTCRLRFLRVDGSMAHGVSFRFECLEEPPPDGRSVPTATMGAGAVIPAELRAAWDRHRLLSTLSKPDFNPELIHFGVQSDGETFTCDGEAVVRFVATGAYRVEAAAGDQFRRQGFDVTPRGEVTIQLRQGAIYIGTVIDGRSRRTVVGAGVVLRRGEAIVASGITDTNGAFRLGPVGSATLEVEVHHAGFERLTSRVRVDGAPVVHELVPLANHRVVGVVRRKPDLRAVGGAEVRLVSGDGTVASVRADASGHFDLRSYLLEPVVEIRAAGFQDYAEMLNANGQSRMFDLIPDRVEERVRLGLTGLVTGRLETKDGEPAANRPVQARPLNRSTPTGLDGRRILRGGRLVSTQQVMTDAAGNFTIEWTRSEAVRLLAPVGLARPDDGQVVDITVGRKREVVLRDPR